MGSYIDGEANRPTGAFRGGIEMAMDFETVKFMRRLLGIVGAIIGGGVGFQYFDLLGAAGGAVIGYVVGWNLVDLFKGRAHK